MRTFWGPPVAPHQLGMNIARNFFGTRFLVNDGKRDLDDVNLHYGILYGGKELHKRCREKKVHFVHVDHGFWGRTDDLNSDQKGYFRFSLNSQANVKNRSASQQDHDRLRDLEKSGLLTFRPRRKLGKWVLYQEPSQFMREYYGIPDDFDEKWLARLRRKHTFVRVHKKGQRLDLDDARLFVSFNSAAGFRALELGIDALMSTDQTVWPHEDLTDGEFEDARREAFAYMAGRTFCFPEMKDGTAFFHMARNGEIP